MFEVSQLFNIVHLDNLRSICDSGLQSHNNVAEKGLAFTPIYDSQIVGRRSEKVISTGAALGDYANVFMNPRNPMLYRVVSENSWENLAIISFRKEILNILGARITDGNAANSATSDYSPADLPKVLKAIGKTLEQDYWTIEDGSKRKIMAEVLIPDHIPPEFIDCIFVANERVRDRVRQLIGDTHKIIVVPKMFFRNEVIATVNERFAILNGDMFFSKTQTLTVSVNTKGIMGKGLASRAKYQFPDVYVKYQDACRSGALKMGKPFLYKRELPYYYDLPDDPTSLDEETKRKLLSPSWFLMFATKTDWRQDGDAAGIVKGLDWLIENAVKQGITSLSMPALGCGLGNLKWAEIGPLMVQKLVQLGIPVAIYAPQEGKNNPEEYTAEYLLKHTPKL